MSEVALLVAAAVALAVFSTAVSLAFADFTALAKLFVHGEPFHTLATVFASVVLLAQTGGLLLCRVIEVVRMLEI